MLVVNDGREGVKLSLEMLDPEKEQPVYKVLSVSNRDSEKRCAFKIKTNSRERFTTAPHVGVLAPGQRITVTVCMKALTQEQHQELSANPEGSKDKFMISSCECSDDITDAVLRSKDAPAWWESKSAETKQHVIQCVYQQPQGKIEVPQRKLVLVREPMGSTKTAGSKRVIAEEVLTLVNNTYLPQAVKVRTTATDRYRVEPSITLIKNGEHLRFKVALIDLTGFNSDRFQIRCAPIHPSESPESVTEKTVRKSEWWAQPEIKEKCYDFMLSSVLVTQDGCEITDLAAEKRVLEEELAKIAAAAEASPGEEGKKKGELTSHDPAKLEPESTLLSQPFRRSDKDMDGGSGSELSDDAS